MASLQTTGLPLISEQEADGEVAELYDRIRQDMQLPFVPNMMKGLSSSPDILRLQFEVTKAYFKYTSLPDSLLSMIGYTIATESDCVYCSVGNELTCRTLGVEAETLERLINDIDNLNPERVRAIIEFALKVAKDPQGLIREDYDVLRDQGVTDEEIVEIIVVAGMAVYVDILADALQVGVDEQVSSALADLN